MCRHLGWTGEPRTLAALIFDPPRGLLHQSYAPREQGHGLVNADGFGAGWYVPELRAEPARYRRSVPIWTDASFASLAPTVASTCVVAAVRSASIGMPVEESATAPFTQGRYLFSHNGRVDADGLRGLLPHPAVPESPCDSAMLAALLWQRLSEPAAQLPEVVARLVVDAAGCPPPGREQATVNVLAGDGTTLCASAWGETLYVRAQPDGVLIASEPGDAAGGWEQVPDRSLVVATGDSLSVTSLPAAPFRPGSVPATAHDASSGAGPPYRPVPEEVS
jgi:glutamine amidotransferase